MTKFTRQSRAGFTLIELLTVIAIIGILAAIIIPTVGGVQDRARRATDLSNMKQIVQSAIIYAQDNNERLPGITVRPLSGSGTATDTTPYLWAATVAKSTGLNDPNFYISKNDPFMPAIIPLAILNNTKNDLDAGFSSSPAPELSVEMVGGLRLSDPSTTPVLFTRGLTTSGTWDAANGAYKDQGGHVAYLGGNVAFYKDLLGDSGTGVLITTTGTSTTNILQTLKPTLNEVYATSKATIGTGTGKTGAGGSTTTAP